RSQDGDETAVMSKALHSKWLGFPFLHSRESVGKAMKLEKSSFLTRSRVPYTKYISARRVRRAGETSKYCLPVSSHTVSRYSFRNWCTVNWAGDRGSTMARPVIHADLADDCVKLDTTDIKSIFDLPRTSGH